MANIEIPVQINGLEYAERVIQKVVDEYDFDGLNLPYDDFSVGFKLGFQAFATAAIVALRTVREEGEEHG